MIGINHDRPRSGVGEANTLQSLPTFASWMRCTDLPPSGYTHCSVAVTTSLPPGTLSTMRQATPVISGKPLLLSSARKACSSTSAALATTSGSSFSLGFLRLARIRLATEALAGHHPFDVLRPIRLLDPSQSLLWRRGGIGDDDQGFERQHQLKGSRRHHAPSRAESPEPPHTA